MSRQSITRVGVCAAVCGRCGAHTQLTVWELREQPRWRRRASDPRPLMRRASCPVCVTTYTLRRVDLPTVALARRRDAAGEPTGREWAYGRVGAPLPL